MGWLLPVSFVLAFLVATQVRKLLPRPRFAPLGTVLACIALVLYAVTPTGTIDLSIGIVLGVGVGSVFPTAVSTALVVGALAVGSAFDVVAAGRLLALAVVVVAAITVVR